MTNPPPRLRRLSVLRPLLLAGTGVIVLAVSVWLGDGNNDTMPAPKLPAPPMETVGVLPPPLAVPTAMKPSFDIVRVNPTGDMLVAGRAAPGAEVALTSNGIDIGHTTADANGQFVILPNSKLPSGGQELALSSLAPNGQEANVIAPILLVVPDAQASAAGALPSLPIAVMAALDAPPQLLQGGNAASKKLGLDIVDYDQKGAIRFTGTGLPNAIVRLYIDDAAMGEVQADAGGFWNFTPSLLVSEGPHRLRLDQVTILGSVSSRLEFPFQRSALTAQDMTKNQVVVQPQQNLWRIAHRIYGHGMRYTEIYQANRSQIRDPNLIFPGQILSMPTVKPVPSAPAISR